MMRLEKNSGKSTFAAFGYAMRYLDDVEFYVIGIEDGIYYKGFICTPYGIVKFDTCGYSDVTKADFGRLIKHWVNLPIKPRRVSVVQLIENWDKYGLWETRVIERALADKWRGYQMDEYEKQSLETPISSYLCLRTAYKLYEIRKYVSTIGTVSHLPEGVL